MTLELTEKEMQIARLILREISERLGFLINVGLDYLTLSRASGTLSGGEAQRIRLATQIGSRLTGVLYILDEPSIGLHQRDNDRLISTLKDMRDIGNTLSWSNTMKTRCCSRPFDRYGAWSGCSRRRNCCKRHAGRGSESSRFSYGQCLLGKKFIPLPLERRKSDGRSIEIKGAKENNLKNVNVSLPLGMFVAITGVSGSGKSTLINEILHKAVAQQLLNQKHGQVHIKKLQEWNI